MRHLEGGFSELAALVHRGLQATFPSTAFLLNPLGDGELGVLWNQDNPFSPASADINNYLQSQWGGLRFRLGNSSGKAVPGPTRGVVGKVSAENGEAPPSSPSLPRPQRGRGRTKICDNCDTVLPYTAPVCTNCGAGFPRCDYCDTVLVIPAEKFCRKCGLMVPSRYKLRNRAS